MFVINEDKSIYLTRGDVAFFSVSVKSDTEEVRKFQPGEVVRFKVYEKKNCENVVLQKDFGIEEETEKATIYLEEKDTKIGGVISKPTTYWYEVELNPYTNPQTIIGYDDDGAKVFMLYPEGNEAEDNEPITPEDVPVVDEELSLTSTRPVQNQAISRAIATIRQDVKDELAIELARVDAIVRSNSNGVGNEEYTLTPKTDGVQGKVISNGINAVLKLTLSNVTIPADESLMIFENVPMRFHPIDGYPEAGVYALNNKAYPGLEVAFINATGWILIDNNTNEDVNITSAEEFKVPYMLANPYIPEINDARFDTMGVEHTTIGAAIRSLEERIKALEENT